MTELPESDNDGIVNDETIGRINGSDGDFLYSPWWEV